MNDSQVIDAEVAEESTVEPVAHQAALVPTGGPALAVAPTVKADELVERLDIIRNAADTAMKRDVDFGVIPGTDKPTLLKPGAEKLSVLFQLDVQLTNEKVWGPDDHLTVISKATVFHAPTGSRLGFGEGICTTREKKYAKRKGERICPECKQPAIIKGKKEYGGGWLCWNKKNGCGTKFPDGDQQIEGQSVEDVDNPDLPDLWNTVVKMAEKRARVDAVLAVTGASALFTQDMEEAASGAPAATQATQAPPPGPPSEEEAPPPEPEPENPLDEERVNHLGKGIVALKITYAEINTMFGALGIDGLRAGSTKALKERLRSLTPEQADKLEAELEQEANHG